MLYETVPDPVQTVLNSVHCAQQYDNAGVNGGEEQ